MTEDPVDLEDLIAARAALITAIVDDMPEAHRTFLIGFKAGAPDWDLIGLPDAADLPRRALEAVKPRPPGARPARGHGRTASTDLAAISLTIAPDRSMLTDSEVRTV